MRAIRRLTINDAAAAGDIHCRAGALIPGYDTSLHAPSEYPGFYRDQVLPGGPVWGVFDGEVLRGHIALRPGWIDHLYVDPAHLRLGIGSRLLRLAQGEQAALSLYTFQSNTRARAFYEHHGFVITELTDGARNEEKLPDMTYHWRRCA